MPVLTTYCTVFETVPCAAKHQLKKAFYFKVYMKNSERTRGFKKVAGTVELHCIMYALTAVSISGGSSCVPTCDDRAASL